MKTKNHFLYEFRKYTLTTIYLMLFLPIKKLFELQITKMKQRALSKMLLT